MASPICTEASGDSFVEAYGEGLRIWAEHRPQSMTMRVDNPIRCLHEVPKERDADFESWRKSLNLGDQFRVIEDLQLSKTSGKNGGNTVKDWIEDRILEQLVDYYWSRSKDDIQGIIDKLENGYRGNTQNALVSTLFSKEDLKRAMAVPIAGNLPCVTHLQFKPSRGTLHLTLTLRSQFIGLKGLGNLVAGGALLGYVSRASEYKPGEVREVLNNITTEDNGGNARKIHNRLNHQA